MSAFPPAAGTPRVVVYHQTQYHQKRYVSLQPLVSTPGVFVTHLIVAAIHVNENPGHLTLNDHPPTDPRYDVLWQECALLQASGTKVMGMLGGAAKGTYARLCGAAVETPSPAGTDGNTSGSDTFEAFYRPLAAFIRAKRLDGLDLDVEESTSLPGIIRLIDRLRADFGTAFILTLAPVAPALIDPRANLSGFSYAQLEAARGHEIAWYNAQFYCGWGTLAEPMQYANIIGRGWRPDRIVAGTVTSPNNGAGFVEMEDLAASVIQLSEVYPTFGGVMGWEYFNSRPGGLEAPWEWAQWMTSLLGTEEGRAVAMMEAQTRKAQWQKGSTSEEKKKKKKGKKRITAPVPTEFEYFTDGEKNEEA
ncbi:Chitinase 2 [Ceratocystis platani]|uniref:Chitinase 2 n=1 Tax=Ceratocystis fimbriata f. sp. platani TaxID=88771 RepID=A0A0F8CUV1_CERFI|nr:Chitinase 2 [Ceratocystis platani]